MDIVLPPLYIISTARKTISLFLAFILTAGTITALFPSSSLSMEDAYAFSGVEKDKIECLNANFNLNGLDVDAITEPLRNLLAA